MNPPICEIHQKPMKNGKFGYFCATPIEKSGDKVIKWCDFKAEDLVPSISESTEKIKEVLATPSTLPPVKTETYRIQKQHQTEMAIRFLDYCQKWSLDPSKEYENVEKWIKIFMESLEV